MGITEWLRQRFENAIDVLSGAHQSIDTPHHEIHVGNHYRAYNRTTASATQIAKLVIRTPSTKYIHLVAEIISKKGCEIALYKNCVVTGGTSFSAVNSHLGSTNTSNAIFISNPTITTTGSQIDGFIIGSSDANPANPGYGGNARHVNEWILNNNTTNEIRSNSFGDNNVIYIRASYYESDV